MPQFCKAINKSYVDICKTFQSTQHKHFFAVGCLFKAKKYYFEYKGLQNLGKTHPGVKKTCHTPKKKHRFIRLLPELCKKCGEHKEPGS